MKKFFLIFMLLLVEAVSSHAQVGQVGPIMPRLPQGHAYTPEQVRDHWLGSSDSSKACRDFGLAYLNRKLREAGKKLVLTANNIKWIFDTSRCELQEMNLIAGYFRNSGFNDQTRKVQASKGRSLTSWQGYCGVVSISELVIPLYKGDCANFIELFGQTNPQIPQTSPVVHQSTPASVTVINNITIESTEEDDDDDRALLAQLAWSMRSQNNNCCCPSQPIQPVQTIQPVQLVQQPMQTFPVNMGFAGGYVQQQWPVQMGGYGYVPQQPNLPVQHQPQRPQQPQPPQGGQRTGGYGVPASGAPPVVNPPGGNGGLPSSPRTGGYGGR